MYVFQAQSGEPGDVVDVIGEAVGQVPWFVVVILIGMIAVGAVLLVVRLRANAQSPDHKPLTDRRGKGD